MILIIISIIDCIVILVFIVTLYYFCGILYIKMKVLQIEVEVRNLLSFLQYRAHYL